MQNTSCDLKHTFCLHCYKGWKSPTTLPLEFPYRRIFNY